MTKIVMVGDCHGNFKKLDEILTREYPFDFFLSTGDVGTLEQVKNTDLAITDKWSRMGFAVQGNHDMFQFFNRLENFQIINNVRVAAFNGMIKTRTFLNNGAEDLLAISHLKNIDVLVTHQAPTGLISGAGEKILSATITHLRPKIAISGHMHRYKLSFINKSFCFSLPLLHKGYLVADFTEGGLKNLTVVLRDNRKEVRI